MSSQVKSQIINTSITATSDGDLVAFLRGEIKQRNGGYYICNASVADVLNAKNNKDTADYLNGAELVFPVSSQIVSEMHVQGYPVAKKINVDSFIKKTLEMSLTENISSMFICNSTSDFEQLVENILDKYPGLNYELTTIDKLKNKQASDIKSDFVWVMADTENAKAWVLEHAKEINGITIGLAYGLNDQRRGISSDAVKRIKPSYILMNLKFIWETGGKFVWSSLSWTPALAMILIIFVFSLQTGEASNKVSIRVASEVSTYSFLGIQISEYSYELIIMAINAIVRTLGHMGEYALLALCVAFAITANGIHGKMRIFYMFFIGMVVSITDETIQFFVPERYCDIADVITDCSSVLLISVIIYYIEKIVDKIKKTNSVNSNQGKRRKFLNLFIDDISFEEAANRIIRFAKEGNKKYVVTPNVDHVIKLEKDATFRQVYENADLVMTDGTPLMWIAESGKSPITEKIPGADMLPYICGKAAQNNLSVFLFGAGERVAETAAQKLKEKYKGLNIVGTYSPKIGFENDEDELKKSIEIINDSHPDILVVGLGAPKQEKFIYKYRKNMQFGVALPFGAAIDFEAGNIKRAPGWMRKYGLEWFYRFLKEPGRLFKRYFIDDIRIFWIAWKYRYETGRNIDKKI